jgi:hypothetical protein
MTENPYDNFDWKSLLTLMAPRSVGAGSYEGKVSIGPSKYVFSALSRAIDSARPRPATRAYARATIPPTMLEGVPKAWWSWSAAQGRFRPYILVGLSHFMFPFGLGPTH